MTTPTPDLVFTDEDLKWWKREHQSAMSKALLHRLECAENFINECRFLHCVPTGDPNEGVFREWRKAAGKDLEQGVTRSDEPEANQ